MLAGCGYEGPSEVEMERACSEGRHGPVVEALDQEPVGSIVACEDGTYLQVVEDGGSAEVKYDRRQGSWVLAE